MVTMASKLDDGIAWLITILSEEVGLSKSLIRHFCFLAMGEIGGTSIRGAAIVEMIE